MAWAFVDYENMGSLEGINYSLYDRVFVFCGAKNSQIKFGNSDISEFVRFEVIRLNRISTNNLDFHLAYYLGKYDDEADEDTEFHIISNDNGFNSLIKHINNTWRTCKRVNIQSNKKQKPLSPCAELAIERLSSINEQRRPKIEDTLYNWLLSQCRFEEDVNIDRLIKELKRANFIAIDSDSTIRYRY